jgi:type I restriction enzyme M protein
MRFSKNMKRSKIKDKDTKISSPFDTTARKTERTAVAILMSWMRNIIGNKNLDLGLPDVETSTPGRRYPDLVIYETRRSQKALCVIEAKPPHYDVFDEKELKEPARKKATELQAKYFCTTNFKTLIWYKTEKVNAGESEEKQIIDKYNLSQIENLDDIDQTKYSEPIKRALEDFLTKLYAVASGREPEPKIPIDEFLVFRLYEKIKRLSTYYRRIIEDKYHKDDKFAEKLKNWFVEQGWSFSGQQQDFDKAARQTAYLLVNKILFYNLLQAKRPQELEPLEIPESLFKGESLQVELQKYFNQALKIDYESIYTTDFIDVIAFPDAKEVVQEIKELINILRRYDFSKLGYDVIGRIFERLIPQDERHSLGQYFTNPDIVDLILAFCLQHEDDKILDPACGAGTFLVRAYHLKKLMNQRLGHEKILETLWGVDIAKFPAHLSTINLAIQDLSVDKNYPNIIHGDFFALIPEKGTGFTPPEEWRKARAKTLGISEREVIYPRWFDAIVGNPPYTRQEEIPKVGVDKEKLIESALKDISGKKLADISKRAGIHAYFFVHGTKFLKDGGYFGFIVSNSWLDVEYGKGLQEFFLKNYKIIAIIESKVERWFEEADVNTCIVILQKCKNEKERNENLVRFVYLKKPLCHFIPPAQDTWEKQIERKNAIEKLKRTILAHNKYYENEELRIFPKKQKELWDEGFDSEEQKYVGAKWGKYLRAPEIFFKILKKGKGKLVPLKEVARVRFGIKTGANDFFYLTEEEIKRWKIEKEFWMHKDESGNWVPNYVIKSPKECKSIIVDPKALKYRVLLIHKDKEDLKGKNVLKYIEWGEKKNFDKRPTCKSRKRWYELPEITAPILCMMTIRDRHIFWYNPMNCYIDARLYGIKPRHVSEKVLLSILNSTLTYFFTELYSRNYGGGGGPVDVKVYEYANMLIVDPEFISDGRTKTIKNFLSSNIGTIFEEIGAPTPEEVSLEKVKPERRELDKIVMGEILGLTDEEQLEVYRAVIDLVKSRIERAKSVKNKKIVEGVDIDAAKNLIIQEIDNEND